MSRSRRRSAAWLGAAAHDHHAIRQTVGQFQVEQAGDEFALAEVAGGTKDNQRTGIEFFHTYLPAADFMAWPPKALRMVDSRR